MNDFSVIIKAILDTTDIGKNDINKLQKIVEKYKINIDAKLDTEQMLTTLKKELPNILNYIRNQGIEIPIQLDNEILKKSINEINREINKITSKSNKISFDIDTEKFSTEVQKLKTEMQKYGQLSGEAFDKTKESLNELLVAYDKLKNSPDDNARIEAERKYQEHLARTKNLVQQLRADGNNKIFTSGDNRRINFVNELNNYLTKNTAITKDNKNVILDWISTLNSADDMTKGTFDNIKTQFKSLDATIRKSGKLGLSWHDKFINAWDKFGGWSLATGSLMTLVQKTKQAASELKSVDTLLTEISKTSELTDSQLNKLGKNSFGEANKYGSKAPDYLKGIQEMSRAGYGNAEDLAALSTLAQSAGDMTADLANDYLIASDAAYGYGGSIEKLQQLLDGQNQVTNRNAVSMVELANATKVAANQLSNMNIEENELTALLGTGIATSREAGETVGRAVKGIMMNLQQVEGETGFDGEVIDSESLKKVEARCHSVGVELEYMQDGIARLRDPMEVLKELAEVYNSLPKDSADRAGIIADIGGKYRGNVLSSILSNWDKYEKMLNDYENAGGSALQEAMKTADSWEGLLNQISNNWTKFVGNFLTDDMSTGVLKLVRTLSGGIGDLVEKFGALPTITASIGATLSTKNIGRAKKSAL